MQHDSYEDLDWDTAGATLGVNWPSDWKAGNIPCGDASTCYSDYWFCAANGDDSAIVYCFHRIDDNNTFTIEMYQSDDDSYEKLAGMTICEHTGTEGEKVCNALGKLVEEFKDEGFAGGKVYKLN